MALPFEPTLKPQPALSQKSLVALISDKFTNLTDARTGENTRYKMSDAALSAFAVFFMQNPSLASLIAPV
jgi:hypothetical protein